MIADEPMFPLFDVNEVFIREVTASECQQLIEGGQATGTDVGVRLTVERSDYCYAASCLSARDAQLIAGEYGDCPEARASRVKLLAWRYAL